MDEILPAALNPSVPVTPVAVVPAVVVKPPPFWVTEYFPHWATENLLGFPLWQWMGLLAAIFIGLVLKTLAGFFIKSLKKVSSRYDDQIQSQVLVAIEKPFGLLVATGFWYASIHHLQFTGDALKVLKTITSILLGVSIIWATYRLVDVLSFHLARLAEKTESDLDDSLVPLFTRSLRIFIIVLGTLILVQNLGFNVMSLIAGLGLGGLAFALAAQDTAANVFGSIMILTDRPFKVGDWIVTSEGEGFVEDIGFRSTRIRTFYDSVISVPNSKVATNKIDNMGQRSFRRIKDYISIAYDTPPDKILEFVEGVKQIILAQPTTHKAETHYNVVLEKMSASSLDIMFSCFVSFDNNRDEAIQKQTILIEILRLSKKMGVELAFPTQTVHVASLPAAQNPIMRA